MTRTGNVDTRARAEIRARFFWSLLDDAVEELDAASMPVYREIVKRFLLHLAWHEGDRLRARRQYANGPARSFFQLEAHRAKDVGAYVDRKGLLGRLGETTGDSGKDLRAAFAALSLYDAAQPSRSAFFPEGNLVGLRLGTSDEFGVVLVRLAFRMVPGRIPASREGHASLWFRKWKVAGDEPALTRAFVRGSEEVDALLGGQAGDVGDPDPR